MLLLVTCPGNSGLLLCLAIKDKVQFVWLVRYLANVWVFLLPTDLQSILYIFLFELHEGDVNLEVNYLFLKELYLKSSVSL